MGPKNTLFASVRAHVSAGNFGGEGVNRRLKDVTQRQQQRPESPTVTLTWLASKHSCIIQGAATLLKCSVQQ